MDPMSGKEMAKRFPVKSSLPCRYFNFLLNSLCWEHQIEDNPGLRRSYLKYSDNPSRFRYAEHFFKKVLHLDVQPKVVFNGKSLEKAEVARQRGNGLFTRGDLEGALTSYNLSIMSAPGKNDVDRTCLVLALGNRSAVFFRQQRYAECIRDIDQAIILSYPVGSVKKLLIRKANAFLAVGRPDDAVFTLETEGSILKICDGGIDEILKLDGDMKDYAKTLSVALKAEGAMKRGPHEGKLQLKFKYPTGWDKQNEVKKLRLRDRRNKFFSSLSAAVDFRYSRKNNSASFVAEREIDAGDVLLVEPTFVSSTDEVNGATHCYSCFCWTDAPLPCSNCSAVMFCAPACANSPKAAIHARECSFWLSLCLSEEEHDYTPELAADINFNFRLYGIAAVRMILTHLSQEEWVVLINEQLRNRSVSTADRDTVKHRFRDADLMDVFWLMNFGEAKRPDGVKSEHNPIVALVAVFVTKLLETEYFSGFKFTDEMRRELGGIVIRALVVCQRDSTIPTVVQYPAADAVRVSDAPVLLPVYSQFTRSCIPNLLGIFHGDQIVVRARRPIKKGESLTAAYNFPNYPHFPLEARRVFCSLSGLRSCTCRACSEDWPTVVELEKQFNAGLSIHKCPCCAHVLGTSIQCFDQPGFLKRGCPRCKVEEGVLKLRMLNMMKRNGFENFAGRLSISDDEGIEAALERVRTVNSMCVEPSFLLVDADELLESEVSHSGNKRHDTQPPRNNLPG